MIPLAAALISTVVPELFRYFGTEKQAEVAEKVIDVAKQVTGMSNPEEAANAIKGSPELTFQFKSKMLDQEKFLQELTLKREVLYVSDTQDARKYRDGKLFILGCVIYGIFFVTLVISLISCYFLVYGDVPADPIKLASITGLVGTIIGYTASQAQAVTNFNFGTSYGSMTKGDDLADAVKGFKK